MKIGILTEIINYHSGARAPLEIARHLAKRGHKVIVYGYDTHVDEKVKSDLENSALTLVIIKKPQLPFIGKFLTIPTVYRAIKMDSPDIMYFAGTPPFFLAGKLTGIPIVRMYQGTQFDAYLENKIPGQKVHIFEQLINRLLNICIYLIDFMSFRLSTGVVTISKYAAYEGKHLYKRKVDKIIYLGTEFFQSHKKYVGNKDYISLLSVSRITPYKGFHLIINALGKVKTQKKIVLTIVGSQPKIKYVNYLKKIGGKNVDVIIDPTDQELAKLYQKSNIYVTADRYLYFGLPIFEAAQFEKPTVSLNFAAANELIVHGKTGFVANNLDEFTNFLQKLIEDKSLRDKLGYNAFLRSKDFSWEKCAQEWEKVIESILTRKV